MAAHQAPPSLGFSRQEHWSGLPFPSPMYESEKWKRSRSVVSNSSRPHGLQPTRLLHPGIFQARILEWVAIAFSNRISAVPLKLPVIFYRTRTKNFTLCMKTQNTLNSESNLEKEVLSWKNQIPWLQTMLLSYNNQTSMLLAQKEI